MKTISSFILICISACVFSQHSINLFSVKSRNNEFNNEVEGNMYFDTDFHLAIVDGKKEKPYMLRYNAYLDVMEFYEGKELYFVEKDRHKIFDFGSGNYTYILENYVPKGKNESINGYLIQLVKGNVTLYKSQTIVYRLAETKNIGFGQESKQERLEAAKEVYYVKVGEANVVELPGSNDKLAELLNRNKKEFSKFMKENSLNMKREKDIVKLFKFINQ